MREYSQGSIRKRKKSKTDNVWEWQGVLYYSEKGRSRQVTKMLGVACDPPKDSELGRGRKLTPSGKGARQALSKLKEWRDSLVAAEAEEKPSDALSEAQTMLVPEYVQYYWDSRDVEPGTRQHYGYLKKHIDCPLLQIPINKLTPTTVQAWKRWMAEEEELGASMQNKCFNQLKYACKWGVEMQQLEKNPCSPVKAPARTHHEPNPLDFDSATRLKEVLTNVRESKPVLADIALLALRTGMRQAELCALSWDDIDGSADGSLKGFIHVNNCVAKRAGGTYLKPYPKNRERRNIPINEGIREVLARQREGWLKYVTDLSGVFVFAYHKSPYEFAKPTYVGKQWNMLVSMSDVKGVEGVKPRFHDLRDTFATLALTSGNMDIATLAGILGHRDTATTLRHYARWVPSANAEAMTKMDNIL